ncbi:hypothetical protein ACFBZI_11605 [Moraxella sp. ZJ142]|uniref:hypothetical protein n=1 Tax=Moraxella marmotae TaxID=3344520 RepID=UPI0035D4C3D8
MNINDIDLNELNQQQLEKVKFMLNLYKLQEDITRSQEITAQTRATVEQMKIQNEKHLAEIEQMRIQNNKLLAEINKTTKETKWFPWLQLIIALATSSVIGGIIGSLATRFFP